MRALYLGLAVLGFVVPYSQFVPWLLAHGLDPQRFVADLCATRIGAFFGLDVVIAAIALVAHIRRQRDVRGRGLAIAATCLVGVSCGLPLWLYLTADGATRVARTTST